MRDAQGHAYNAKDIHVRFLEPLVEAHCDSKLRLILDSTVHWTESKITETERRKGNTAFIHSKMQGALLYVLWLSAKIPGLCGNMCLGSSGHYIEQFS